MTTGGEERERELFFQLLIICNYVHIVLFRVFRICFVILLKHSLCLHLVQFRELVLRAVEFANN